MSLQMNANNKKMTKMPIPNQAHCHLPKRCKPTTWPDSIRSTFPSKPTNTMPPIYSQNPQNYKTTPQLKRKNYKTTPPNPKELHLPPPSQSSPRPEINGVQSLQLQLLLKPVDEIVGLRVHPFIRRRRRRCPPLPHRRRPPRLHDLHLFEMPERRLQARRFLHLRGQLGRNLAGGGLRVGLGPVKVSAGELTVHLVHAFLLVFLDFLFVGLAETIKV